MPPFQYDKKRMGREIQKRRLAMGMTQEKLGEAIGKSLRHVVDTERGVTGISLELLVDLCNVLQVTPNELLLPNEQSKYPELNWIMEALKLLTPAQRQTAVSILSPYIVHMHKGGEKPLSPMG